MRKDTADETPCIHRRRLLLRVTWGIGAAWAAGLSACAHDPAPPTADAQETVTAVREPDGRWRVGGYFVR